MISRIKIIEKHTHLDVYRPAGRRFPEQHNFPDSQPEVTLQTDTAGDKLGERFEDFQLAPWRA